MVFGVKLTQNVFRFQQVFQDFLDKIGCCLFVVSAVFRRVIKRRLPLYGRKLVVFSCGINGSVVKLPFFRFGKSYYTASVFLGNRTYPVFVSLFPGICNIKIIKAFKIIIACTVTP